MSQCFICISAIRTIISTITKININIRNTMIFGDNTKTVLVY